MDKVGLWSEFNIITKIFIVILLLFMLFMGVFIIFAAPDTTRVAAVQQNNTEIDLNNFANYHKQLIAIEKPLDDASDIYRRQSKAALRKSDLYALYDSAKNLHDASMEALDSLSKINIPYLNNQKAQQSLEATQDNFNTYIGAIRDMSSSVMTMANTGNPTPELANNIQEYAQMYQAASINTAVDIIKTYDALGIKDIDRIDINNGGLLPINKKGS